DKQAAMQAAAECSEKAVNHQNITNDIYNNYEDNDDNDDEEILPANSPLGRYAAEVGLSDAVSVAATPVTGPMDEIEHQLRSNDPDETAIFHNSIGIAERFARLVVSRTVSANVNKLRLLLDDDDMRLLLLALSEDSWHWKSPVPVRTLLLAALPVLVVIFAVYLVFDMLIVLLATIAVVSTTVISCLVLLQLLARWLASVLNGAERCLASQRACLRLARERLQVERGFTLVRGAANKDLSDASNASLLRRSAPALNRAAFESGRRLTHSIRRLARDVELGGLAYLTDDSEFGEAFNANLALAELIKATDGFAPTALASMAALLQMHLSDVVLRFLLAFGGCSHSNHSVRISLFELFRNFSSFENELWSEVDKLEIRLERHRKRDAADVDALLEEFLGGNSSEVLVKSSLPDSKNSTPLQAAARSLRLQAEALLVKAALAERNALTSTNIAMIEIADIAMEARVYAVNAAACCDEIATAVKPPAAQSPPTTSASLVTAEPDRPVVLVSQDTAPAVEDEFLEGLVPDVDGDADGEADNGDVCIGDVDEAARRAATRRVLGELDSVILQRRRLFRQREQAARARRGLPLVEGDGDGNDIGRDDCCGETVNRRDDADSQPRRRRRIVWHGTLEGDGDARDGETVFRPSSLLASIGASPSTFAATAMAARQLRGIRLNEEAFGDDDSDEGADDLNASTK
ncbi:hypothetical protein BOX15_Mlig022473g1, partial [Macrostomum lignano]